jgi:hypothetical protein
MKTLSDVLGWLLYGALILGALAWGLFVYVRYGFHL